MRLTYGIRPLDGTLSWRLAGKKFTGSFGANIIMTGRPEALDRYLAENGKRPARGPNCQ